jgi:hypothetical protein
MTVQVVLPEVALDLVAASMEALERMGMGPQVMALEVVEITLGQQVLCAAEMEPLALLSSNTKVQHG